MFLITQLIRIKNFNLPADLIFIKCDANWPVACVDVLFCVQMKLHHDLSYK